MIRLTPMLMVAAMVATAVAAPAGNIAVAEKYFFGEEQRQCTPSGDRCAGTHDKPYVKYAPCCEDDDACSEKPELGWGLFCVKDGKKCYGPSERCAGTADRWVFEMGCCGDYKCEPNADMGWGSFCMPNYSPAPSYNVAPATTAAPVASEPPAYYAPPATTATPVTSKPPAYYAPPATAAPPAYPCGSWVGSNNKVVIETQGSATGNWQNQGDGIMYKPWNHDPHHIVTPGDSEITYNFVVPAAGEYMVTMVSSSPMQNEHNDCWVKSDHGLAAIKPGHSTGYSYHYVKAYSNAGYHSKELRTVDHDPHTFHTHYMQAGETGSVTIAGRSSRFKIHKIVLVKCGASCYPWDQSVSNGLHHLTGSAYMHC